MTKVLIKHKDGSTSGPYNLYGEMVNVPTEEKTNLLHIEVMKNLGLEVIPYEEPKVEITKEKLADAWNRWADKVGICRAESHVDFPGICKELGLEE